MSLHVKWRPFSPLQTYVFTDEQTETHRLQGFVKLPDLESRGPGNQRKAAWLLI